MKTRGGVEVCHHQYVTGALDKKHWLALQFN